MVGHRAELRAQLIKLLDDQKLEAIVYLHNLYPAEYINEPHPYTKVTLSSVSGLPAIVVPAGFTSQNQPVGIEFLGRPFSEPTLLLLDEPSAGMTHDETTELMDDILIIRARMPELTIVIIEHGMSVIERITNRCVVLNYGRKLCEGTYREIARNAEVQQAYLGKS